jgi:glycosyltransferase involved in cell wall biosynthesis
LAEPVTLCIPAYKAAAFLERTLDSAYCQTWPDCEIVISVDAGGDATADLALRHATTRPNLRVVVQPGRLGWIATSNAALAEARTRYAMILPHDDVLAPDYVAVAMDALRRNPAAVVAYTDLTFVEKPGVAIAQPSVTGSFPERMAAIISDHFSAVAYRGVLDLERVRDLPIPASVGGFAADTLWFARLACRGELVRVPGVHYFKHTPPTSTHAAWAESPRGERHEMWAVHCYEMLRVFMTDGPRPFVFTPELQQRWITRVLEKNPYTSKRNPLFDNPARTVPEHVAAIVAVVGARPKPYSWVRD